MPTGELNKMNVEDLAAIRERPEYQHLVSRLTDEVSSASYMDDFFNKWTDPDVLAVLSAEVCDTESSADGFVLGALVGLMIAEYRMGEPNVAAK